MKQVFPRFLSPTRFFFFRLSFFFFFLLASVATELVDALRLPPPTAEEPEPELGTISELDRARLDAEGRVFSTPKWGGKGGQTENELKGSHLAEKKGLESLKGM